MLRVRLTHAGHEIVVVANGREALERLRATRPDLLLVETMVPELDGVQLLKQMKQDAVLSSIPVVVVSARTHEDDILADFLLTNDPLRFERRAPQFAAVVEEMTGRRPTEDAVITALGVEAHYLETAFGAIHEQHGSLDAYLQDVLGVDAARRAAIVHRILD